MWEYIGYNIGTFQSIRGGLEVVCQVSTAEQTRKTKGEGPYIQGILDKAFSFVTKLSPESRGAKGGVLCVCDVQSRLYSLTVGDLPEEVIVSLKDEAFNAVKLLRARAEQGCRSSVEYGEWGGALGLMQTAFAFKGLSGPASEAVAVIAMVRCKLLKKSEAMAIAEVSGNKIIGQYIDAMYSV